MSLKKVLSLALVIALMLGMIVPATANDDNEKIADYSLDFSFVAVGEDFVTEISSVAKGETFYVYVNYANDPGILGKGTTAINLHIKYEPNLVTLNSIAVGLNLDGTFEPNKDAQTNVAEIGWLNQNGLRYETGSTPIGKTYENRTNGTFCTIVCTANTNISGDDLVATFSVDEGTRCYQLDNSRVLYTSTSKDIAIKVPNSISIKGDSTIAVKQDKTDAVVSYSADVLDNKGDQFNAVIDWSLEDVGSTGVSLSEDGKITVEPTDKAGLVKLTATATMEKNSALGKDVSVTKEITITKADAGVDQVYVWIGEEDYRHDPEPNTISIPNPIQQNNMMAFHVKDQYGAESELYFGGAKLVDAPNEEGRELDIEGVTFDNRMNHIRLTDAAAETILKGQTVTFWIAYTDYQNVKQYYGPFYIEREASVPTTVEISGDDEIEIPVTGSSEKTYTVTVKDQYGADMTDEAGVSLEVSDVTGVSISQKTLTVASNAEPTNVTLTATADKKVNNETVEVTATKTVTVQYAASELKSLTITNDEATFDSLEERTVTLTAKGTNQYGHEMAPENVTWDHSELPNGVSISNGVVTIAKGAYGTFTVKATSGTISSTEKTITVNGIYMTGMPVIEDVTYGETYESNLTTSNVKVFFGCGNVSDEELSGVWSVKDENEKNTPENVQTKDLTCTFISGTYSYAVTLNDVSVAPKPVTVTLASKTISYGDAIPTQFDVTVNAATPLVSEDSIDALNLIFAVQPSVKYNVGSYYVVVTQDAGSNYVVTLGNGAEDANSRVDNALTIVAKNLADIDLNVGNLNRTYIKGKVNSFDDITAKVGEENVEITVTGYTVDGVSKTKDELIAVLNDKNIGNYTVTVSYQVNDGQNYQCVDGNAKKTLTATVSVSIVYVDFVGEEAFTVKSAPVFGDTWAAIFPEAADLNENMITAYVGEQIDANKVTGSYKLFVDGVELTDLTDKPDAKASYSWEIKFYSDDTAKTYDGVTVASGNVKVEPLVLTEAMISEPADQVYSGEALEPQITITTGAPVKVDGSDFIISYSNNTNAAAADAENAPTVTVSANSGNYSGSISKNFDIAKRTLTISGAVVASKTYDGNKNATVSSVAFGDVTGVDYTATAEYQNANAQANKIATVTVTLTGDADKNNVLSGNTITTKGTITPKEIQVTAAVKDDATFTYNKGKQVGPSAAQITVTPVNAGDVIGEDVLSFSVSLGNDFTAGKNKSATVNGTGNYTFSATATYEIEKATTNAIKGETLQFRYDVFGVKTAEITGEPEIATYTIGTLTGDTGILENVSDESLVTVDDKGVVSFKLKDNNTYDKSVTIPVTVSMANYEDVTVEIVVNLIDKIGVNPKANDMTAAYTGEAFAGTPSGTATAEVDGKTVNVPGKWAWDSSVVLREIVNKGEYTAKVVFTPDNTADYMIVTDEITITITKAEPAPSIVEKDEEGNLSVTIDEDAETLADIMTAEDFFYVSEPGNLKWYKQNEDDETVWDEIENPAEEEIEDGAVYKWEYTPAAADAANIEAQSGLASRESDDLPWWTIIGILGGASTPDFDDVPDNAWFAKAVDFVVGKGLFNGVSDDEFNPNGSMTRAMLVTVLWRLEGEPVVGYENSFRDVADGTWYDNAVTWASANGLVKGYDAYTFGPNNLITREQMATILYRYAEMRNLNTTYRANLSKYTDAGSISGYAREAMSWAVDTGIISGMTETTLSPTGTATRAQVATILMRFVKWFGL